MFERKSATLRRRHWLPLTALCLAILAACSAPRSGARPQHVQSDPPPTDAPNILFIWMDDMRFDQLDAMPQTMARLSHHGVRFTQGFVHSPLCCPDRASTYSGRYVHQHGVFSIDGPEGGAKRFDDTQHLGTWLQAAGYRTGFFGKWANGVSRSEMSRWPYVAPGWDDWCVLVDVEKEAVTYRNYTLIENGKLVAYRSGEADYHTTVVGRQVRDFIMRVPSTRPFLAIAAFIAPHMPATPANRSDLDTAANYPLPIYPSFNETDVSDKPPYVRALAPFTAAQKNAIGKQWQHEIASLQEADRQIDSILTTLENTDRADNTIIIFASDNGVMEGENRLEGKKDCAYDGCVRTPFIVKMPGITPRVDTTHLVSTLDIPATILAAAGAKPTLTQMGLNLLPLLADPATPWRNDLLIELLADNRNRPPFAAVRTLTDTYIEYLDGFAEYYDLTRDPYEMSNRAADAAIADRVNTLKTRLAILRMQ